MEVGARIKELRERRGFSQNKLAEWAGISQSHLRRVELGEADITVGRLCLICETLGVSVGEFFDEQAAREELDKAVSGLTPEQRARLIGFLQSLK